MISCSLSSSSSKLACHAPAAHDDHPVGKPKNLFQLGRDENAGEAVGDQFVDKAVNLVAGAYVHAAGRLVQDQDAGRSVEPLGEIDLLLVAAAEMSEVIREGRHPDVKAVDIVAGAFLRLAPLDKELRVLLERGEGDVDDRIVLEQQAAALAVFGKIGDAGVHRIARALDLHGLALDFDHARLRLAQAHQCFAQLGAPGAHEPGDAQDFAALQREGDVFNASRAPSGRARREQAPPGRRRPWAGTFRSDHGRPCAAPSRARRARRPGRG